MVRQLEVGYLSSHTEAVRGADEDGQWLQDLCLFEQEKFTRI